MLKRGGTRSPLSGGTKNHETLRDPIRQVMLRSTEMGTWRRGGNREMAVAPLNFGLSENYRNFFPGNF